jgi:hypothetical protein
MNDAMGKVKGKKKKRSPHFISPSTNKTPQKQKHWREKITERIRDFTISKQI